MSATGDDNGAREFLDISVGEEDTFKGVRLGVDGDVFWRTHLTPQGEIYMSDGTSAPVPLAEWLASDLQSKSSHREWLTAQRFSALTGSPALVLGTGFQVWLLDSATTERVTTGQVLPTWMTSVDVDVIGYNAGAGSGTVQLQLIWSAVQDGQSVPGGTATVTPATFAAVAQNIRQTQNIATGLAVPAGAAMKVQIARLGASDTLGNDWGFLGVVLRPSS